MATSLSQSRRVLFCGYQVEFEYRMPMDYALSDSSELLGKNGGEVDVKCCLRLEFWLLVSRTLVHAQSTIFVTEVTTKPCLTNVDILLINDFITKTDLTYCDACFYPTCPSVDTSYRSCHHTKDHKDARWIKTS